MGNISLNLSLPLYTICLRVARQLIERAGVATARKTPSMLLVNYLTGVKWPIRGQLESLARPATRLV